MILLQSEITESYKEGEGASRYAGRYRDKEFIFKGLLRCKKCGRMFSTYI